MGNKQGLVRSSDRVRQTNCCSNVDWRNRSKIEVATYASRISSITWLEGLAESVTTVSRYISLDRKKRNSGHLLPGNIHIK